MTAFDCVAALAAYHAALDARDLARVEQMLAPGARYMSAGIGDVEGRATIMQSLRDYFANCPDHQAFDDELEAVSSHVALSHWRLRATNRETGQHVERHGIEKVTFTADGLICRIDVKDH